MLITIELYNKNLFNDYEYNKVKFDNLEDKICNNELLSYDKPETKKPKKNFMSNFGQKDELLSDISLLMNHPIYGEWVRDNQYIYSNNKENYDIVIIVISAPIRYERRNNIRQYWWKDCNNSFLLYKIRIKCLFFTELPDNNELRLKIQSENVFYKDVIFQPISSGIAFGQMLLFQLFWTFKKYNYKWFIKTDDDIYLCLKQIINRLPQHIDPLNQHYIKGHLHCEKHRNRVDESFITLSYSIIETFLKQPPHQMKCHPWADQQIAIWVQELGLEKIFFGDEHYLFDVEFSNENYAKIGADKRICSDSFDGLHAVHYVWNYENFEILNQYSELNTKKQTITLMKQDYTCSSYHHFLWCSFGDKWVYYPEFCYLEPIWNVNKQLFLNSKIYVGKKNRI